MTSHEERAEQFRPDTPFGFGFGFDPTGRGPGLRGRRHGSRRHECDPRGEFHEQAWAGRRDPAPSWTVASGRDSGVASARDSASVSVNNLADAGGGVASVAMSGPRSWHCSPSAPCTATR